MLVIVTVCLLAWICALVYWRARIVESHAHPLPPAYPGYLPIIGHTHLLLTDQTNLYSLMKTATQYASQQGDIIYAKVAGGIYYVLTDPEDGLIAANVFLEKHFLHDFAKFMLGGGLITGSGAHWRRHRELLKSNFGLRIVNSFLEEFNCQSKAFLRAVECHVGKGQFNPTPYLKQLSLGTSYLTTFGRTAHEKFYPKYMEAVEGCLELIVLRFQKFWLQNEFIYNLSEEKKKETQYKKTADEVTEVILQTKRSVLNGTNDRAYVPYQPFIDLMLEQNSKNNFSDQEISEELHTNVVAAFETTTHSLETILVMIGSFPKVQEKIYEEIMQVIDTKGDIHKDDIRKLVYTEAVINESLRVHPTVPVTMRAVHKDLKLKNYTLRAGSTVMISRMGMLHHSSWGPDVEEFRPERWLDTDTLPCKAVQGSVFGTGKRSCLGRTYAMTSMKVTVAQLVRKYIITADHTKLKFKTDLTIKAVAGNEISLKPRIV